MISPQSRDPEGLCPCIRKLWKELQRKVPFELVLVETLRQPDRQEYYVGIGVSTTMHSKHLPQPPHGLALAFDCVPKSYLADRAWNPTGVLWERMGVAAEYLGLTWGGRWKGFVDKPHCQLTICQCPKREVI